MILYTVSILNETIWAWNGCDSEREREREICLITCALISLNIQYLLFFLQKGCDFVKIWSIVNKLVTVRKSFLSSVRHSQIKASQIIYMKYGTKITSNENSNELVQQDYAL